MANPQPTDGHLRIAHSIEEEIMTRDFSKRQRSIMDLILRLSWGCGKKTAIIPMLKDFEIVGIDRTKIKCELDWLLSAKVIFRIPEKNEYSFNKNYDEWKLSIVPGYNRERLNHLLNINISLRKSNSVDEKAIELPSRGQSEFKSNTTDSSLKDVSKESIKESITNKDILNINSAREDYDGYEKKVLTEAPKKSNKSISDLIDEEESEVNK